MPGSTLFLVDGSSYIYRAFFALPPLTTASGLPANAVYGFTNMLLKLLKDAKPQMLGLVFDAPGGTFRDELYAEYKSNRSEMPSDLAAQIPLINEVVAAFAIPTLRISGVEADDVIGCLTQRSAAQGMDCIVVTSDKDLMQLVGPHTKLWDTMRDKWTDEAKVRERFGVAPAQLVDIMGLVGDPIDNIPGVRGIGEKTASALIQHFGSIDRLLENLDEVPTLKLRGAKKVAELLSANAEQARLSRELARIRCDLDLDAKLSDFQYPGPDPGILRQLFSRLGFQSLVRELPSAPTTPAPEPIRLETAAAVASFAGDLRPARTVALACAATGAPMTAPCDGVVLSAADGQPCWIPIRPELRSELAGITADPDLCKVGHNLKSDIVCLARRKIPLVGPLFDTMVACYMVGATVTHRLEDLSRDLLGEEIAGFRGGGETSAAEIAAGVQRMHRVRDALADRLAALEMERLFHDVEMPLTEVLARMEERGVRLDVKALAAMGDEWRAQLQHLTDEIYGLAGGEFNIGSPPQLREILFERLSLSRKGVRRGKTGLSTDVDVLTRLAVDHPLPAKILEYRALAKLLSTYVDALLSSVHPETGRLHTVFNQAIAATGRLSSSDPNLQNIPARGEEGRRIRSAFIPGDGCVLLAADYSQIELRVMAHLSEDPVLISAFNAGEDIHARTAAEIFGALPGTATADMRRVAKVINFGIMYGMGPQRLAAELGIPHAAAQRYIQQYFERYQGVRAFIERTIAKGRECGYVSTMFGRRRTVPELNSRDRNTAQAAERAAINMPIQGTAADLIKIAMVRIDQRMRAVGLKSQMVLQVHDELVLEVPTAELELAGDLVREEMERAAELCVPLAVEVGFGTSWAEAH